MKNYMDYFRTCRYTFSSSKSILAEEHLGICSDISSIMTPECSVAQLNDFQGCPYTNTGFSFDIRVDGEKIKCENWQWLPHAILRSGSTETFGMESLTAVIPGMRTVVQKIVLSNKGQKDLAVPLQVLYRGRTRREENWTFAIPKEEKGLQKDCCAQGRMLSSEAEGMAFRLTTSLEGMQIFQRAYLWETEITIPSQDSLTMYFSAHMGEAKQCLKEAVDTQSRYEELLEQSFDWLEQETERIDHHLPRLTSDVPELNRLYDRSLVTYILCRWENPDLCVSPFFSTGSVNGGCMCSYLWDYCGGLKIHPLYDQEGNKNMLKAYLKNDLTTSYALNPVTGGPTGPWYMINQEKIIRMVYFHVLFTGDKDFLQEQAGERTVLEWMKYHAYVCDDLSKDVELYDYGQDGDNHLELMFYGNGPYNGIMPDLNARRYRNYMLVYELTKVASEPDERLPQRAAMLKEKLKELWNEEAKWYDFIDADGNRDIRYTCQMFKFLNSDVIDEKEREGLISHLNEREFLSKFGLHSMSKLDPQYDQDDIDNGGGGICTHFVPQICFQLYETGHDEIATELLRRIYWWGERMPYLGDSMAANMILNRENTPLQGDISSVSIAQMIFLAVCGIKADFEGNITISPVKVRPAENMKLDAVRLCGKTFCVDIHGDEFSVVTEGRSYIAKIGEAIVI